MTISVHQQGDNGASTVNSGVAATVFGSNTTIGNYVVLSFVCEGVSGVNDISGLTSGMATTLTRVSSLKVPGYVYEDEMWVGQVTGTSRTVTATLATGSWYGVCGQELTSSVACTWSSATGGTNSNTTGTAGSLAVNGLTSGQFVAVEFFLGGTTWSAEPSSPWTAYNGSGDPFGLAYGSDVAWQVVSGASVTASWTWSGNQTWETLGVVVTATIAPPTVSNEAAFSYGATIEVLSATVTPYGASTTVSFSYGPTNSYGNTSATFTVPVGAGATVVQIPITGLTLGNTYHYQCVATNSAGTTDGTDATFVTTGLPTYEGG